MELVVSEIIRFLPVPKPGELELVACLTVSEENEDEASVIGYPSANLGKVKGLLIETDTLVQIQHVEIIVGKPEFHSSSSFRAFLAGSAATLSSGLAGTISHLG
jgi:hypothetical protein